MYNAQATIERVQAIIKQKGDTQKRIFEVCGLDENTLKKMSDKRGISSFYLAKIADELKCSVDYLLGRSDNPQSHKCPIAFGDISNNNGVIGGIANSAPVTINNGKNEIQNNQEAALLEAFRQLDEMTKAKALIFVDELNGEK